MSMQAPADQRAPAPADQRVVVSEIRVPFFNLVLFFVKAALAMIPAAIILWVIGMLFWGTLGFLFAGNWSWMMHRWPY